MRPARCGGACRCWAYCSADMMRAVHAMHGCTQSWLQGLPMPPAHATMPCLPVPARPLADCACKCAAPLPQFKKGDKVFCLTPGFFNATPEGCYAEYVAAEADWLARVPDALPLDKVRALGGSGQGGAGCEK